MNLEGSTTCPHCKKDHDVAFNLDKLDTKATPSQANNASISGTGTILEEKPKEIEKIVEKTVIEDFKPNYECPNGNCDLGVHKNTNYKKKPKGKCTNCDQFTKHSKGTCPWCKKNDTIEEIDKEELEELGIEEPIIDEHLEHNHG